MSTIKHRTVTLVQARTPCPRSHMSTHVIQGESNFTRSVCCLFCGCLIVFDCKCKCFKRLGGQMQSTNKQTNIMNTTTSRQKNNRHTGYPAQDPTANRYLSGSGWEMMYLCVCFVSCLYLYVKLETCYVCYVCICVLPIVNATTEKD